MDTKEDQTHGFNLATGKWGCRLHGEYTFDGMEAHCPHCDGAQRGTAREWTVERELTADPRLVANPDLVPGERQVLVQAAALIAAEQREHYQAQLARCTEVDKDRLQRQVENLELELKACQSTRLSDNQYLLDERDRARREVDELRSRGSSAEPQPATQHKREASSRAGSTDAFGLSPVNTRPEAKGSAWDVAVEEPESG